jgi:hypothetical protein
MKKFILIYLLLRTGFATNAQFEKIIQPSDLKQQTIVTEPVTLRKGFFRAEAGIIYFANDKYFNESGKKEYYPFSEWGSHYRFNFSIKYGITDRFEIDVYAPVVNNKIENYYVVKMPVLNTDESNLSKLKDFGLGDMSLMLKYQLIPEKEKNISLSLFSETYFPTGPKNPSNVKSESDYRLPPDYGYFSTGIYLFANIIRYPYSASVLASYHYNFWGSKLIYAGDTEETKFKKGNRLMAGGRFNIHLNEWIAFGNELYYFHSEKGKEEGTTDITTDSAWDIDYVPRLVFQVRRFRISELVQIPLFGKNGSADPLYSLLVQYTF